LRLINHPTHHLSLSHQKLNTAELAPSPVSTDHPSFSASPRWQQLVQDPLELDLQRYKVTFDQEMTKTQQELDNIENTKKQEHNKSMRPKRHNGRILLDAGI
jgi:hypothetical protein